VHRAKVAGRRRRYALGNHTASLGLAFSEPGALPRLFTQGAFIGQHGSWNRRPHSGYKVIFVPFLDGRPAGPAVDVLTGFLDADEHALGRPVGIVADKRWGAARRRRCRQPHPARDGGGGAAGRAALRRRGKSGLARAVGSPDHRGVSLSSREDAARCPPSSSTAPMI
jgi:hypothetical protein